MERVIGRAHKGDGSDGIKEGNGCGIDGFLTLRESKKLKKTLLKVTKKVVLIKEELTICK